MSLRARINFLITLVIVVFKKLIERLCWVQKVSNLILNINIEVRSVRGVRRLVENIPGTQSPFALNSRF